jgi:flavin reductase (DIM6/NTAB) family NADH-FMN oxidoreductase RutF
MNVRMSLMSGQEAPIFNSAEFRTAMRSVPGAVSIVTTGTRPGRHGLTLTAGCSLSTEPSSVLVCVNKSAGAHDTIKQSGVFCWNILAAEHASLARTFSGQDGSKGDVRFAEGVWRDLVTGAPSLIEAICSFDCRVIGAHDGGSHTIFVGEVLAQSTHADREPLVYVNGNFAVPKRAEVS